MMSGFKFLLYQVSLWGILFLSNMYVDQYIGRPFSRTDFIAALIALIQIPVFFFIFRSYRRFNSIGIRNRIMLSVLACILVFLFLGLLQNVWFTIKGDILFQVSVHLSAL